MKTYTIDGQVYRLSNTLNPFQLEMQTHLVNWKWEHITRAPLLHRGHPNDALLSEPFASRIAMLYPAIREIFEQHKQKFHIRLHK